MRLIKLKHTFLKPGKLFLIIFLALSASALLSACSKKDEPVFSEGAATGEPSPPAPVSPPAPPPAASPSAGPSEEPSPEPPKFINPLTGLGMSEEAVGKRPFAFVINNMKPSLPQYGIGQADIIYEVLAEGNITRMVAFFQDLNEEKIGSMRSARDYFISFAWDHDAIFVHHGGSPQAYQLIRTKQIDDIDGMDFDGTVFKRDPERWNTKGMKEHSSFTAASRIKAQAEKFKYRAESKLASEAFDFYGEYSKPAGEAHSDKITINHISTFKPYFTWDESAGLYSRFEYDQPQVDGASGEQLKFTNIVVQKTTMRVIDSEGRRVVDVVGSGGGWLFTGGIAAPITWEKSDKNSPTKWYDGQGNKLKLNKGKTWLCVTANEPDWK